MIVISEKSGLRSNIGYKEIAKKFLEFNEEFVEENFMLNMLIMLDDWEKQEGLKFERIMPSDWEMIWKAIKVLSVEGRYTSGLLKNA